MYLWPKSGLPPVNQRTSPFFLSGSGRQVAKVLITLKKFLVLFPTLRSAGLSVVKRWGQLQQMDPIDVEDDEETKSKADTRRRELLGIGSLMKQSSMPELSAARKLAAQTASEAAATSTAGSAPSFSFMRTASAEDETVGAIRTRVMNAQFVKQRSSLATVKENAKFDPKKGMSALRSVSMPSKLMKQVDLVSSGIGCSL